MQMLHFLKIKGDLLPCFSIRYFCLTFQFIPACLCTYHWHLINNIEFLMHGPMPHTKFCSKISFFQYQWSFMWQCMLNYFLLTNTSFWNIQLWLQTQWWSWVFNRVKYSQVYQKGNLTWIFSLPFTWTMICIVLIYLSKTSEMMVTTFWRFFFLISNILDSKSTTRTLHVFYYVSL